MNQYKANRVIVALIVLLATLALFTTPVFAQEQPQQDPIEAAATSDIVKQELVEWMQALRQATETGAAFAGEQVPLIIQEKIAYSRVYYTWVIATSTLIIISFFIALRKRIIILNSPTLGNIGRYCDEHYCTKRVTKEPNGALPVGQQISTGLFMALHGLITVIATITFLSSIETLFQIWFAPRLYIVEWLISFAR